METKKEFRYFTIFNHQKEEDYLRKESKEGWRFVKVSGIGIYHFEKCAPEDVVYKLDYPQKESSKESYIKIFEDCGWEYIQEYVGYSYFRKKADEKDDSEDIFNDEDSRVAMMERVYKMRVLPLLVLFSACLVPQFVLNLFNGRYLLASVFCGILLVYLIFFIACAVSYYRAKNK